MEDGGVSWSKRKIFLSTEFSSSYSHSIWMDFFPTLEQNFVLKKRRRRRKGVGVSRAEKGAEIGGRVR